MLLTFLKESMTMNVCSNYTKDSLVEFDLTTDQGELLFSLRLDHEKVYICITSGISLSICLKFLLFLTQIATNQPLLMKFIFCGIIYILKGQQKCAKKLKRIPGSNQIKQTSCLTE